MKNNESMTVRDSSIPLHVFIDQRMKEVRNEDGKALTNQAVATALGYQRPNVVAMLKNGTMRVPLNKVVQLASILQLDKVGLLKRVMAEYNPETWEAIESIMGTAVISENEGKLLSLIRKWANAADIDYTAFPEFVQSLQHMVQEINDREAVHDLSNIVEAAFTGRASRANREMEKLLLRQAKARQALRAKLLSEDGDDLQSQAAA